MFFAAIILIGVITFNLLPVEMMPNISFGDITINIDVRGGIPASEIEKSIAKPVEEAVGSVTHLKNILSISKEGNCTVILEFEPGTNMDFAALEVREKFNRIRNKLPSEIEKPVIAKYEYMDVPIMILAVTSQIRNPEELRKVVDDLIKDRIQRIEGIARAEVSGGRESKILIEIDPFKLQTYGLSINQIVGIININNANLLAGEIKRTKDKYLVRTIGEFRTLADIENLSIAASKEGSVIRLKDIAEIKDSYLDPVAFARLNAQPVVSIYVQKESTGNTVKIAKLVHRELKSLEKVLDKDIKIASTFNQAEAIQQAVNQVKTSLLYGAALATIILLIFLRNLRAVFIIATSIPISLLLTFCLMFFNNLTINVMTLSGLALGVGMLVDNAIVVLDNTFKKREEALPHLDQLTPHQILKETSKSCAIEGAEEMFIAIIASTLTTIIVFLPLVFINPEIRMLYSGIALTITYSLFASLIAAVTLVPMLAARIRFKNLPLPPENPVQPVVAPAEETATQKPKEAGTVTPVAEPMAFSSRLRNLYKNFVSVCLSLRYLILILAILGFTRALQETKKLEKEFIGIAEQNKFTIFVEMPTGTRLEVTDKVVAQVEEFVSRVKEVKTATSKIEPWSSKIYVELQPLSKRERTTPQIISELRTYTEKLDPAFIYYEEPEEIGTKEILIEIYGYDYQVLKGLAIQIAQRIQTIPKFTDTKIRMREGRPEMRLNVNKMYAALLGLSTRDVAMTLHTHMRGMVATHYRGKSGPLLRYQKKEAPVPEFTPGEIPATGMSPLESTSEGKETETIVRLEERYRKTFEALRRVILVTKDGEPVFLSQLANFKFDIGPSEIWRKNKFRMVQVSANTGGVALGTAADKVKEVMKNFMLPKDYFWQLGGNYDKMIRNQSELSLALLLSLILVYMLLAGLFESFSQPFIILMTVPLAAIGAIIALRLTNKPVGTGVLIGSIMLGGIVVNNAIVLIDRINFLRHKRAAELGLKGGIRDLVITASFDRLRPIMITSLTTILGLVPMALDRSESSSLWSPLAITVIGGMTLATFLTLFIIPCVYMIFVDLRLTKR